MSKICLQQLASVHQLVKDVLIPTVQFVTEFIKVTLQQLNTHMVVHIQNQSLSIADNHMNPWENLVNLLRLYYLGNMLFQYVPELVVGTELVSDNSGVLTDSLLDFFCDGAGFKVRDETNFT